MIQIDGTIVSMDVATRNFQCELSKCKGACCIQGDSGAPMEEHETRLLENELEAIKPYMRQEGIEAIEEQGLPYMTDSDGDVVTVLVNNKECSFVIFENGTAKCAIEKAYFDGKTNFRKPLSCHLYPVRTKKYKDFEGVNYDQWEICKPAVVNGKRNNTPLYIFLREALVRKYGEEWYNQLSFVAQKLEQEKG
jgi:hypothetical protein